MPHPDQQRLAAFHDGELPPAETESVSEHVERCVECGTELRALARVGLLLTGSTPSDPPAGLWGRIEAAAVARNPAPLPRVEWWPRLAAAAAGALLLLGVASLTVPGASAGPSPVPAPENPVKSLLLRVSPTDLARSGASQGLAPRPEEVVLAAVMTGGRRRGR